MITTFYPPYNFGGDGIFIYRLSNELASRGHYVEIIHCTDAYHVLNSNVPTDKYPHHPNIKIHSLKSKFGFLSALLTHQTGFPFLKSQAIKNILNKTQFDVIHFHNISLIGGPGILRYGKAVKLYTTHEHWLVCPLSVLWKMDREACNKQECFSCMLKDKRPPQLWRYTNLLKMMSKHVDAFISPSIFTIKKHREMGLNLCFVHIPNFLPHAYENEVESKNNINKTKHNAYFLYVGRLEKNKGAHILIDAFKKFTQRDLLIAGDGLYKDELENLAQGIKHIKFLGKKTHEELNQLYQNAIAVIVPSLCYETFGMIILEAFAWKTPVIVNNLGALPELVEQSQGGFIYNNQNELIKAMNTLCDNSNVSKKLGKNGYQAFKKFWTEKVHFESYFNLIQKILKTKHKNSGVSCDI